MFNHLSIFYLKRGARIPPGLFNVLSLVVVVRPLGRRPLDLKSNKSPIGNYTEINDGSMVLFLFVCWLVCLFVVGLLVRWFVCLFLLVLFCV